MLGKGDKCNRYMRQIHTATGFTLHVWGGSTATVKKAHMAPWHVGLEVRHWTLDQRKS